jgi:hypothetical protein
LLPGKKVRIHTLSIVGSWRITEMNASKAWGMDTRKFLRMERQLALR